MVLREVAIGRAASSYVKTLKVPTGLWDISYKDSGESLKSISRGLRVPGQGSMPMAMPSPSASTSAREKSRYGRLACTTSSSSPKPSRVGAYQIALSRGQASRVTMVSSIKAIRWLILSLLEDGIG